MPSGSIPRPIAYALSFVIVMLGFSISYQVFLGSSFSYESKLGSIQLGQGEDATTLAEFVDQSQEALAAAKESIANLEEENNELREQIVKYEKTMREIQLTASASESSSLQDTVSSLSSMVEEEQVSSKFERNPELMEHHRILLDKQLTSTRALHNLIESQKKENN